MRTTETQLTVPEVGAVSAIVTRPPDAWLLYVLAHGAGAGMRHQFLEIMAEQLGARGVATLRYQFPYMEQGRNRPDTPKVAQATVRAAVESALEAVPDTPVVAGGKSFGGRMTSHAEAAVPLGVAGLVFLGFPLHAPGKPGDARAAHLSAVTVPMLFLQGTRDPLADLDLMRGLCGGLGSRVALHVVEGGDHSFKVLKKSGRSQDDVFGEMADSILGWAKMVLG